MLDTIAAVAESRYGSPEYTGSATDAIGYMRESLTEPSVFVVAGYGTLIGKRVVSPMPDVSTGSISLDAVEIAAVIAYMQALSGLEVTVEIPRAKDVPNPSETNSSVKKGLPDA